MMRGSKRWKGGKTAGNPLGGDNPQGRKDNRDGKKEQTKRAHLEGKG